MQRSLRILLKAGKAWNSDDAFMHSAAVSFYTLFSLAPITIIAVAVAGILFESEVATQQFTAQMTHLVGQDSAGVIQKAMLANAVESKGWISTTMGVVLLVIGATTVFGQLRASLNSLLGVETNSSRSGWVMGIVQRLVSFAMVLTLGFLLLTSLILSAVLASPAKMTRGVSIPPGVLQAADLLVGLVTITVLFAILFKVLPDVKLQWREVWRGAFATSILFTIGRFLIALYLGHSTVASSFGTAEALVGLLIWIYYSSAIFFFGAEFIRAYRFDHGLEVEPKGVWALPTAAAQKTVPAGGTR